MADRNFRNCTHVRGTSGARLVFTLATAVWVALTGAANAQWMEPPASRPAGSDYNNSNNWVGGVINGIFSEDPTTADTVTFAAPTTISGANSNSFTFSYVPAVATNLTLESFDSNNEIVNVSGTINATVGAGTAARIITIGTASNPLTLNFTGATALANSFLSSVNTVLVINAQITGATAGLDLRNTNSGSATSSATTLTNDTSTFTGIPTLGGGGSGGYLSYTSMYDAGVPSSLGEAAAFAFNNGNSLSTFQYIGAGSDSTNREIQLNANGGTGIMAIQNSAGAGSLTFTGTLQVDSNTSSITGSVGTENKVIDFTAKGGSITASGPILTGSLNTASSTMEILVNGNNGSSPVGLVVLSNTNNNYNGLTIVQSGTLAFASIADAGSVSSALGAPAVGANSIIQVADLTTAATLKYIGGGDSSNRVIDLGASTGVPTIEASGSGALVLTGGIISEKGALAVLTLSGSSAPSLVNQVQGTISNNTSSTLGVTKTGSNTWQLSGANLFTGPTTINAGILQVTNLAVSSATTPNSLGEASSGPGNLVINSGTLQFVGAVGSGTSNRQFTVGAGGATLDASGAGALVMTSTGGITVSTPGTHTLTLTGANTAGNKLAAPIGDTTNATAGATTLVKNGSGTWTISPGTGGTLASTYTGPTLVNAGKLIVAGTLNGTATITVAAGATLAPTAFSSISTGAGDGSLNALLISGTLSPGDSGIITSATLTLQAGTKLNFAAGSHLSVDVDGNGNADKVTFASADDWLAGSGNLTIDLSGALNTSDTYTLFSNVTTSGFTVAGITGFDNIDFSATLAQQGTDYVLSFSPVPEPGTAGIVLPGAVFLGAARLRVKRRRRVSAA